jgi:hypothetical protein
MYVYRNNEGGSCNFWCSEKSVSTTCFECLSVALVIQHTMRMRHIVICGLPGTTTFFHITSQRHNFQKKKVIEHEMWF